MFYVKNHTLLGGESGDCRFLHKKGNVFGKKKIKEQPIEEKRSYVL